MNEYYIGTKVRFSGAFTVVSVATDPTTLVAKTKNPSGTIVTYTYGVNAELVKDSVGNYHLDVSLNVAGTWAVRFAGTGTCEVASEDQVLCLQGNFW